MTPALAFRPLGAGDLELLSRWLGEPHMRRWWDDPADLESVCAKYLPRIEGTDPVEVFVVQLDGEPVGMIQRYRGRDFPDGAQNLARLGVTKRTAGIDYSIGEARLIGQGLGTRMIEAFVRGVFADYDDIETIVVDVDQANVASWRALEKAGFGRIWSGTFENDSHATFLYALDR